MTKLQARSRAAWAVSLAVALPLVAGACSSSGSKAGGSNDHLQSVKFVTAAAYAPQYAPWYYGAAQGYFSDQGIDLNISNGTGSATAIQGLAAGNWDCGYIDAATASTYIDQGLKVKVIALTQPLTDYGVIAFSDKGIKSPEDLKGKTVAVSQTAAATVLLPAFLKATGMQQSDFKTENMALTSEVPDAVAGKVDALLGNGYSQGVQLAQTGHKQTNTLHYSDYGVPLVGSGFVCSDKFLEKNPDLAKKFVAAGIKSYEMSQKNEKAAVEAGSKANPEAAGSADADLQLLDASLKVVKPGVSGHVLGYSTDDMWSKSLALLQKYQGLKDTTPSDYYTNEYLPKS